MHVSSEGLPGIANNVRNPKTTTQPHFTTTDLTIRVINAHEQGSWNEMIVALSREQCTQQTKMLVY